MKTRSLRARLLLAQGGLTMLALLLVWLVLQQLLTGFVDRRFTAELQATADAVMTGANWQTPEIVQDTESENAEPVFTVNPSPTDPRFDAPQSGWYWQVTSNNTVLAASRSLLGLSPPEGQNLYSHQRIFTAPGDGRELVVWVSMPNDLRQQETAQILQPLSIALLVLATALISAGWIALRVGLVSLDDLQKNLLKLRRGELEKLPTPPVIELQPLAQEINTLLTENAQIIHRARDHVGNLAHALKTPMSVLKNQLGQHETASQLIERMESTLRWHLKRARAAGQLRSIGRTTSVTTVLEDLKLVLQPMASQRQVSLKLQVLPTLQFAGEAQDLEEILGNLLENALKWTSTCVEVAATLTRRGQLQIEVKDDGPGISPEQQSAMLNRGARADESTPGSGLGLAIVVDLIALYQGRIHMKTNIKGGLTVVLELPSPGQLPRKL